MRNGSDPALILYYPCPVVVLVLVRWPTGPLLYMLAKPLHPGSGIGVDREMCLFSALLSMLDLLEVAVRLGNRECDSAPFPAESL